MSYTTAIHRQLLSLPAQQTQRPHESTSQLDGPDDSPSIIIPETEADLIYQRLSPLRLNGQWKEGLTIPDAYPSLQKHELEGIKQLLFTETFLLVEGKPCGNPFTVATIFLELKKRFPKAILSNSIVGSALELLIPKSYRINQLNKILPAPLLDPVTTPPIVFPLPNGVDIDFRTGIRKSMCRYLKFDHSPEQCINTTLIHILAFYSSGGIWPPPYQEIARIRKFGLNNIVHVPIEPKPNHALLSLIGIETTLGPFDFTFSVAETLLQSHCLNRTDIHVPIDHLINTPRSPSCIVKCFQDNLTAVFAQETNTFLWSPGTNRLGFWKGFKQFSLGRIHETDVVPEMEKYITLINDSEGHLTVEIFKDFLHAIKNHPTNPLYVFTLFFNAMVLLSTVLPEEEINKLWTTAYIIFNQLHNDTDTSKFKLSQEMQNWVQSCNFLRLKESAKTTLHRFNEADRDLFSAYFLIFTTHSFFTSLAYIQIQAILSHNQHVHSFVREQGNQRILFIELFSEDNRRSTIHIPLDIHRSLENSDELITNMDSLYVFERFLEYHTRMELSQKKTSPNLEQQSNYWQLSFYKLFKKLLREQTPMSLKAYMGMLQLYSNHPCPKKLEVLLEFFPHLIAVTQEDIQERQLYALKIEAQLSTQIRLLSQNLAAYIETPLMIVPGDRKPFLSKQHFYKHLIASGDLFAEIAYRLLKKSIFTALSVDNAYKLLRYYIQSFPADKQQTLQVETYQKFKNQHRQIKSAKTIKTVIPISKQILDNTPPPLPLPVSFLTILDSSIDFLCISEGLEFFNHIIEKGFVDQSTLLKYWIKFCDAAVDRAVDSLESVVVASLQYLCIPELEQEQVQLLVERLPHLVTSETQGALCDFCIELNRRYAELVPANAEAFYIGNPQLFCNDPDHPYNKAMQQHQDFDSTRTSLEDLLLKQDCEDSAAITLLSSLLDNPLSSDHKELCESLIIKTAASLPGFSAINLLLKPPISDRLEHLKLRGIIESRLLEESIFHYTKDTSEVPACFVRLDHFLSLKLNMSQDCLQDSAVEPVNHSSLVNFLVQVPVGIEWDQSASDIIDRLFKNADKQTKLSLLNAFLSLQIPLSNVSKYIKTLGKLAAESTLANKNVKDVHQTFIKLGAAINGHRDFIPAIDALINRLTSESLHEEALFWLRIHSDNLNQDTLKTWALQCIGNPVIYQIIPHLIEPSTVWQALIQTLKTKTPNKSSNVHSKLFRDCFMEDLTWTHRIVLLEALDLPESISGLSTVDHIHILKHLLEDSAKDTHQASIFTLVKSKISKLTLGEVRSLMPLFIEIMRNLEFPQAELIEIILKKDKSQRKPLQKVCIDICQSASTPHQRLERWLSFKHLWNDKRIKDEKLNKFLIDQFDNLDLSTHRLVALDVLSWSSIRINSKEWIERTPRLVRANDTRFEFIAGLPKVLIPAFSDETRIIHIISLAIIQLEEVKTPFKPTTGVHFSGILSDVFTDPRYKFSIKFKLELLKKHSKFAASTEYIKYLTEPHTQDFLRSLESVGDITCFMESTLSMDTKEPASSVKILIKKLVLRCVEKNHPFDSGLELIPIVLKHPLKSIRALTHRLLLSKVKRYTPENPHNPQFQTIVKNVIFYFLNSDDMFERQIGIFWLKTANQQSILEEKTLAFLWKMHLKKEVAVHPLTESSEKIQNALDYFCDNFHYALFDTTTIEDTISAALTTLALLCRTIKDTGRTADNPIVAFFDRINKSLITKKPELQEAFNKKNESYRSLLFISLIEQKGNVIVPSSVYSWVSRFTEDYILNTPVDPEVKLELLSRFFFSPLGFNSTYLARLLEDCQSLITLLQDQCGQQMPQQNVSLIIKRIISFIEESKKPLTWDNTQETRTKHLIPEVSSPSINNVLLTYLMPIQTDETMCRAALIIKKIAGLPNETNTKQLKTYVDDLLKYLEKHPYAYIVIENRPTPLFHIIKDILINSTLYNLNSDEWNEKIKIFIYIFKDSTSQSLFPYTVLGNEYRNGIYLFELLKELHHLQISAMEPIIKMVSFTVIEEFPNLVSTNNFSYIENITKYIFNEMEDPIDRLKETCLAILYRLSINSIDDLMLTLCHSTYSLFSDWIQLRNKTRNLISEHGIHDKINSENRKVFFEGCQSLKEILIHQAPCETSKSLFIKAILQSSILFKDISIDTHQLEIVHKLIELSLKKIHFLFQKQDLQVIIDCILNHPCTELHSYVYDYTTLLLQRKVDDDITKLRSAATVMQVLEHILSTTDPILFNKGLSIMSMNEMLLLFDPEILHSIWDDYYHKMLNTIGLESTVTSIIQSILIVDSSSEKFITTNIPSLYILDKILEIMITHYAHKISKGKNVLAKLFFKVAAWMHYIPKNNLDHESEDLPTLRLCHQVLSSSTVDIGPMIQKWLSVYPDKGSAGRVLQSLFDEYTTLTRS